MSKYACVDVGGTFTDAAVVDENGSVNVFKSPTTPHDWTEGILGALRVASEHYEEPFDDFLKDISVVNAGMFTHGSTIATNAVVEKKCGKVGILCTEGFRDVFLFREGPNKNPFDMFLDYPEPFVPRYLTLPVKERINAEGGVDTPLDEEAVKAQTLKLKGYNVEAIAVCFLWSTVNPAHEQRAAELIHEVWPDVTVVLSSEVNPSNREYRRWVSAAMDASLRKLISSYANDLNGRLNDAGFVGKGRHAQCRRRRHEHERNREPPAVLRRFRPVDGACRRPQIRRGRSRRTERRRARYGRHDLRCQLRHQ